MPKRKHDRKCPCGSGELFKNCCQIPKYGETPIEVKNKIKNIVVQTFNELRDTRGELCLYVANLVKDLLKEYGYKSYVVAGEAKWNNYPAYYQWKPNNSTPEFHV